MFKTYRILNILLTLERPSVSFLSFFFSYTYTLCLHSKVKKQSKTTTTTTTNQQHIRLSTPFERAGYYYLEVTLFELNRYHPMLQYSHFTKSIKRFLVQSVLCWPGLYIRAGSRRSSPASLPGFTGYFHCFTSLNMSRRWTHNRLLFTKLRLLKNLKKTLVGNHKNVTERGTKCTCVGSQQHFFSIKKRVLAITH